ncbi:uncharacterized protein J3R85_004494 [Psidium guajava]|nr:uncharacterized protein J3R85_004494 [Psidium guajava]
MVTNAQYLLPFIVTKLMMVLLDNMLLEFGVVSFYWCVKKPFSL